MSTAVANPCDEAKACATKHGTATRHPGWTLATCIAATSLAFIDGSVTNVALPAIGRSLHASASELQWVVNAYLLPLSALLLMGGAAGDHFGRRKVLVFGTSLFALSSLACAIAPGLPLLLAARAVQGIGAALLMPNSLGILGAAFSGEAKGRAVGTWAAAGAIFGAVGPPLGGWLIDAVDWRAIFYINLPVAAAAIALALAFVEESHDEAGRSLDWLGAIVATAALGALTWGITLWSAHRQADAMSIASVAIGAVLLGGFVWIENKRGERAMMPLAMFGSRAFVGLTVLTFLLYGALGGLMFLVPYTLIQAAGYTPLTAGFALLPFAIVVGLSSRAMGRLTARMGPRWPMTLGCAVTAVGFALLTLVRPDASYWSAVLPGMLVIAIGMAGVVAPLTTAVLSAVDDAHTGTASGFNSAISRTGGLIVTALSGAVIAAGGAALIDAFHIAALAGAGFAIAAAVTAFLTLSSDPEMNKPSSGSSGTGS